MRSIRILSLVLVAVAATSALGVAAAQAEEPYWKVKGARLKAGKEKEVTLAGTESYVIRGTLGGTKFAITCPAPKFESPGKIFGSEPEEPATDVGPLGRSTNCKKIEVSPECWKVEEEIVFTSTKSYLSTWQDSQGHNVTGELLIPIGTQKYFALGFEGPGCPPYEPGVEGTIAGGFAIGGKAVEVGSEKEASALEFFFPTEPIKEATVEGIKTKVGLTFNGAPLTVQGRSVMKLLSGEEFGTGTK
jgi:hypothetical protein